MMNEKTMLTAYENVACDIPQSLVENLNRFGVYPELRRISLTDEQVRKWNLPPAPTKQTDSRSKNWDGQGQVELDAVRPEKLMSMLEDAILNVFDKDAHDELIINETRERALFRSEMLSYVNGL